MDAQFEYVDSKGVERLTAYALACGYLEVAETETFKVQLSSEGCYHVKASFHANKGAWQLWECFDTLTEARKFMAKTQKSFLNLANSLPPMVLGSLSFRN